MTLRLTKPSLSLPRPQSEPRPQSTVKPESSPRVGPHAAGHSEKPSQQISNTADRFETTAPRASLEERIRDRRPGGIDSSVGGQPIPEHQRKPWNQETYGERIDRNRADRGLPPIFSPQEPEIFSPHGPGSGKTYGEQIDRNRERYEQVFGDKPVAAGTSVSTQIDIE